MKKRTASSAIFVSSKRLAFVVGALSFVFCCVIANLCYLHTVKSDWSESVIEKARMRFDKIEARRGDIVDSHGNLLATSRPIIELGVDPEYADLNNPLFNEKIKALSEILDIEPEEILPKFKTSHYQIAKGDGVAVKKVRWRKLADAIDNDTYERVMDLGIKGVYGTRKYARVYPSGALTAHSVGFVNKVFSAETGIERQFDYYLRGQDGWRETERDVRGREMAQFRTQDVKPVDGMCVETTIDLVVQEMANREIKGIVDKYDPKSACIIVSDPSTGYILAMASYPNFDPNEYNKYPADSLRNRAICDVYEPGSTFKIVPIAAALNESIVGPEDTFDCKSPTISHKGRILRLPQDTHLYENLSVREIAKKSSNRGVAQLAVSMGENKLYEYSKRFGFGESTNLGLIGERKGTLHPVKKWDGLTITRLPMGHAVDATPLQVHCAMCVIANQGIYMQPQMVRRVYDASGDTKINFPPKAIRRVISPKIASLMSDILAEVTEEGGTATRAKLKGFRVAGKTGTSQKLVNNVYSKREHIASFSGFFPAQRPRIAITVVVDCPKSKGIGYGGVVAAPSFCNIAAQTANYLGIKTDEEFEKMVAWKAF